MPAKKTKGPEAVPADEQPEVKSQPGDQGIATQEEDPAASSVTVWDRAPTQEEFNLAGDALEALLSRAHEMTPEQTVDHLLRCVDVHQRLKMPELFPGKDGETLHPSQYLGEIGRFLLRGCQSRLKISPSDVIWLWRDKKTWTSGGQAVRAKAKTLNETERHLTGGCKVKVVANFRLFRLLNTRQKIAAIYHALRSVDAEGRSQSPQFTGWFDEIALFGTGTWKEDANLLRAIEHGSQRELPWNQQPSLFDMEDEAEEPAEEAPAKAA